MPMTLVRAPQAVRRTYPTVLKEVKVGLDALGKVSTAALKAELQAENWSPEHIPEFKYKVVVNPKKWRFSIVFDSESEAGQIYVWVGEGTGERGGHGDVYIITPKNTTGNLVFNLPALPKSIPSSGMLPPSAYAPPGTVYVPFVEHHGIEPREFGKELYELLRSRRSGSFHNVMEASVKRGLRKSVARFV